MTEATLRKTTYYGKKTVYKKIKYNTTAKATQNLKVFYFFLRISR